VPEFASHSAEPAKDLPAREDANSGPLYLKHDIDHIRDGTALSEPEFAKHFGTRLAIKEILRREFFCQLL
jgi:hypothetical protein